MKLKGLNVFLGTLFLLLIAFTFFNVNVLGATYDNLIMDARALDSNEIADTIGLYGSFTNAKSGSSARIKGSSLVDKLIQEYSQKMSECAKNNFVSVDMIETVTVQFIPQILSEDKKSVSYGDMQTYTYFLDEIDFSCLHTEIEGQITFSFKIGSDTYKIYTYSFQVYELNSEGIYESKWRINSSNNDTKSKGYCASNTVKFFELLENAIRMGLVSGSIEYGYNVASPYTTVQRPLSDLLALTGSNGVQIENEDKTQESETKTEYDKVYESNMLYHYDFKTLSSVKYAFSYFYHPLLGKIDAFNVPKTDDQWFKYIEDCGYILKNGSIQLSNEFNTFKRQLAAGYGGLFTSNTVRIENGVKKMGVGVSEDPQTVLSYNVYMYTPYIFSMTDTSGRLITSAMKPIEGYIFCLYDNNIYDSSDMSKPLISMSETGLTHDNLYLYFQDIEVKDKDGNTEYEKVGIVVIGLFEECIVDETKGSKEQVGNGSTEITNLKDAEKHLYFTGRRIGFDNGYSDSIDFERSNVNSLYVRAGYGTKVGIVPKSFAFPLPTKDLEGINLYSVVTGRVELSDADLVEKIETLVKPKSDDEIISYVFNINNHSVLPVSTSGVYMYTGFGGFFSEEGEGDENTYYTFYIIRNNKYVTQDTSLINWLRSDEALALSHVRASELLAKITGDFTQSLDILTYKDWLRMQEIGFEIEYEKSTVLVRIFNVMSIIMGVVLIIFGVLFILCYWVDIFNTLNDFSILHYVSFKNLYPVEDKELIPYVQRDNGNTKFVTFKDVLIISCIMFAVALLFFNIKVIIYVIVSLYFYIMSIMGGV